MVKLRIKWRTCFFCRKGKLLDLLVWAYFLPSPPCQRTVDVELITKPLNLDFPSEFGKKKRKVSHLRRPAPEQFSEVGNLEFPINDLNINLLFPCLLASMAPSRKHDIAAGAVRALIAGTVACFMTACIAGTAGCPLCPVSRSPQSGSFQGSVPPTLQRQHQPLRGAERQSCCVYCKVKCSSSSR